MCGIVAAISGRDIVPVLVQGLARLEYRGYDSCGVAIYAHDPDATKSGLRRARSTSRVSDLATQVAGTVEGGVTIEQLAGSLGIAHTRWATHGGVTEANCHPHTSANGRFAVVHNGIIENYSELKIILQDQ